MTKGNVANNTNDILEIEYHQNHYLIKDNIENKQINEIEELPETRNCNNPAIMPY